MKKKILTEQRLCELAGLQKEAKNMSRWNPKTNKYEPLEDFETGPTGTIDLDMDPDHISNAPVTTALPVGEPPIPHEKPWGRSGPAPEDAETAPFMRALPPPGSPAANYRNPAPEADPVEGDPGMFWHPDPKGEYQRADHPGKWKKLPIGVTRSARAYEKPVSAVEKAELQRSLKHLAKKIPSTQPGSGKAPNTDIDSGDLALGGVTPEEAQAILARQRQKKD